MIQRTMSIDQLLQSNVSDEAPVPRDDRVKVKVFYTFQNSDVTYMCSLRLAINGQRHDNQDWIAIPLRPCLIAVCSSCPDRLLQGQGDVAVYSANFAEKSVHGSNSPRSSVVWEGHGWLRTIVEDTQQVVGKIYPIKLSQSEDAFEIIVQLSLHPQTPLPPAPHYAPHANAAREELPRPPVTYSARSGSTVYPTHPSPPLPSISTSPALPSHVLPPIAQPLNAQENYHHYAPMYPSDPRVPSPYPTRPSSSASNSASASASASISSPGHSLASVSQPSVSEPPTRKASTDQENTKKAKRKKQATGPSGSAGTVIHTVPHSSAMGKLPIETYYHKSRKKKRDTKPPNADDVRPYTEVKRNPDGSYQLPVEIDSWTVIDLGKVVWDRQTFHNQRYIYPVGYCVKKWYRSMIDPQSDTQYTCKILDGGNEPIFELEADDNPGEVWRGPTPTTVWTIAVRRAFSIRHLDYGHNPVGPDFFGLRKNTIAKMIQDLPGAEKCENYIWQNFQPTLSSKPKASRRANLNNEPSTSSTHQNSPFTEGSTQMSISEDQQPNSDYWTESSGGSDRDSAS